MQLTFLGTRNSSERGNALHRRHSALLFEGPQGRVMIDCGSDWLSELPGIAPDALLLTHAHPDHSGGLEQGSPCPVYATAETWQSISNYPLRDKRRLEAKTIQALNGLLIQAVPLDHSLRAPTVGLRIQVGKTCLFYAPDVAALIEPASTLRGVDLYIGDGSALDDSLLRIEQGQPCGHAPILNQLQWCGIAGIKTMVVTHCGEAIIADEAAACAPLATTAAVLGIDLNIAYDGLQRRIE